MHILDVFLRWLIQSVVMAVWGALALAFVAVLTGKIISFVWRKLHPIRAVVHIENHDVIEGEWVEV